MNYQEAVTCIENYPRFKVLEPLLHTKEMLKRVGDPQDSLKVVHVAGTNGKGSVCAYLDAMFREGGFKCGLFTSPHLVKVNERFKINGQDMSDDDFLRLFKKVKTVGDDFVAEGKEHPTYFEIFFIIGMLYFKEQNVDVAILETGIGGRLDSTNAVDRPLASVISSIGIDHIELLGDTMAQIAREKAGIIKPKVPVVFEKTNDEVANVIRAEAQAAGAMTYQLDDSMYEIIRKTKAGIDFSFYYKYYRDSIITINSIASYQMANASLALLTMAVLKDFHQIPPAVLCRGIAKASWSGRMEMVLPGVVLDGAHNEAGVLEFIKTALEFKEQYPITILFTAMADKDYLQMIHLISDKIKPVAVVTTQINSERGVSAEGLAERFIGEGCENVYSNSDVVMAFEQACQLKGEGLLFCIGSLYMIGAILGGI